MQVSKTLIYSNRKKDGTLSMIGGIDMGLKYDKKDDLDKLFDSFAVDPKKKDEDDKKKKQSEKDDKESK